MWNEPISCELSQPCEYCIATHKKENWFPCPVDHDQVFISCRLCFQDYVFKYKFEEQEGKSVYKNFGSVIKHFNGIEYLNILNKRIDEFMKSTLKNEIHRRNYFENDYILGCHIIKYIDNKIIYGTDIDYIEYY